MLTRSATILAAAFLLAAAGPASAQNMPKDPSAAANVRQSEQYEQLLHSNSSFRAKRIQEECGPIADKDLHEECVASFGSAAPAPAPHPKKKS